MVQSLTDDTAATRNNSMCDVASCASLQRCYPPTCAAEMLSCHHFHYVFDTHPSCGQRVVEPMTLDGYDRVIGTARSVHNSKVDPLLDIFVVFLFPLYHP
eukprot:3611886-Amphidinium_carterae.1